MVPADEIVRHLPLVRELSRRYRGTALGYDDAVGVGALALVAAAAAFDRSRGVPFAYYAGLRIRGAMTDAYRLTRGWRSHQNLVEPWPTGPDDAMANEYEATEGDLCATLDYWAALSRCDRVDQEMTLFHLAGWRGIAIARLYGVHETRVSQRLRRVRAQLLACGLGRGAVS